ncbi:MAG: diguanylate cyclase [Pseudomonadota bacterium]
MLTADLLVVSSVAANRACLAEWLAPLGLSCCLLEDEAGLLQALRQRRLEPPRLLIVDGHPADECYPLLNRLQGEPAAAELPVLLLADNLADASRRFYSDLLFGVECLPKPVNPLRLRERALACLSQEACRRDLEGSLAGADWGRVRGEALLALDASGHIRYASRHAARWLRLSPLALGGLSLQSLLELPVTAIDTPWAATSLARALGDASALELPRLSLWRGDGGSLAVQAALMRLPVADLPLALAFRPLQAAAADDLATLARVDLLTGLPARPHLEEALRPALAGMQPLALLLLDLDHLRHINETLGYDLGDQLLRAVATRLRAVRESGLLASLGGGRFALMVESVSDYRVAGRLAQRLQAQLRLPFLLAGHEVFCSVSVGIGLAPSAGDDAEQLLRAAERALERAKALGRGVIQFAAAEQNRFGIERLERETAFHQALREERLELGWRAWRRSDGTLLALQPLARWPGEAGQGGEAARLAEECGRARELSEWLLRRALHQPSLPPGVALGLALTPAQLVDAEALDQLAVRLLRQGGTPAQVLLFVPWRTDEAGLLRRILPQLAAQGWRLALSLEADGVDLEALAAARWQALVLGAEPLRRLAPEAAPGVLAGLAALAGKMGCGVFCEGAGAAFSRAELFALGIEACSEDLKTRPSNS